MYLHTIGLIVVTSAFFKSATKVVDEIFSSKKGTSITAVVILFVSVVFYMKYYIQAFLVS